MNQTTYNAIVNFIWNIADDVLRDVYVRGKYRDVILPMTVLRRLDSLLEPTKDKVLERHKFLNEHKIYEQADALTRASGYQFYNTSRFTFRRLLDEPSQIRENFEDYLTGFSPNVQLIISKFKLHNQLDTLDEAGILYALIQKFMSRDINLSPEPVIAEDGAVIHEGLSNLGMGYVFEDLIRRFNEENNEEAGEHFTPRDIIKLMAHLVFLPIKDHIESGTYLVYDCACGSGGMLTEAESFLQQQAAEQGKKVVLELYGQEVNPETFAICQSDMLIKGKDPSNIKYGSTLKNDGFPSMEFDFMLTNPPYGKSWAVDYDAIVESVGQKKEIIDRRFAVGVPRSSDGQLLFLCNFLSKMKTSTSLGSRIATIHNGSSLFTGDAGQGESEIRKWIIENDWLECIVGLPLNMLYNTGIATYIWVVTNRKSEHRRAKIQLIDATSWFSPLRKNLGKKNCELQDEHIERITSLYLEFQDSEHSKIFDNADFGYHKITVERPLRLTLQVTPEKVGAFKADSDEKLHPLADLLQELFGVQPHKDFNVVKKTLETRIARDGLKVRKPDLKKVYDGFTCTDETAMPVIRKKNKDGTVHYEPDVNLRDTESVPLRDDILEFFRREVLPYVPDAWIDPEKTTRGYEISFTRHFYRYEPLRSLEEIKADILTLEAETEGLLHQIVEAR